jgi:tRNA (guanine-N7-)-methyltransferase
MSRSQLRIRRHANPFSVPKIEAAVDWAARFGRRAPLEVEIGPSGGRFFLERARSAPAIDIVGLEIRTAMVERLAERISREGLTNAAVVHANANQALAILFGPGALSRLYAFHPDPWVKKRHLKRRLFTPEFARAAAEALAPGGELIAQSDVLALAEDMRAQIEAHSGLVNLAGAGRFAEKNPTDIPSETELYWLELGAPVYYLHFRKPGEAPAP